MIKEIWKDVVGYEGVYKVSNLGSVKSIERYINRKGHLVIVRERLLELSPNSRGYGSCNLYVDGVKTNKHVHVLVAVAFLNHIPNGHVMVVNHINGDRQDNIVSNLLVVTKRENSTTCFSNNKDGFSSKYVGVHWSKANRKWVSKMKINRKTVNLGSYINEIEASNAYQVALKKLKL